MPGLGAVSTPMPSGLESVLREEFDDLTMEIFEGEDQSDDKEDR